MAREQGATAVRLSAVRRQRAIDDRGADLGTVLDVRVVQDGPVRDGATASLRVDGLVIGHGGLVEHLGLLRHQVRGPWAIVTIAKVLGRPARYARWKQVVDPHALGTSDALHVTGPLVAFEDVLER